MGIFLWGGVRDNVKYHLVVCSQIQYRGLGIRKLGTLNPAFLGNWVLHYAI